MRLKPCLIGCLIVLFAGGCERHLYFDANGFAHGTGEQVYAYKSGAVKLREDYKNGKIVCSRWFKPNGELIQETDWKNGTGEGIYLREDGSIKRRMEYVNGIAEGEATNYDESGHATQGMYHHGRPVQAAHGAVEIGLETTRVLGPVLADGTVDYDAALWAALSAGVTAENNAGPLVTEVEHTWKQYAKGESEAKGDQLDKELTDVALKRPWKDSECPDVAAWLKANEHGLALAEKASTCSRLCGEKRPKDESGLVSQFSGGIFHEMARGLVARAMQRAAAGDGEGARQDIAAVERLARLLVEEPDMTGGLLALPLQKMINEAELGAIRASSKEEAGKWLAMRERVPPIVVSAAAVDVGNRFGELNNVMLALRGQSETALEGVTFLHLDALYAGKARGAMPGDLAEVDWNVVLRRINAVNDEATAILTERDVTRRCMAEEKLAEQLEAGGAPDNLFVYSYPHDIETMTKQLQQNQERLLAELQHFLVRGNKETVATYSARMAMLFTQTDGLLRNYLRFAARNDAENASYTAAMAVEAYRIDHRDYPESLREASPYVRELPKDPFTGKDLLYRRLGTGYVVYSVGADGKDDGGVVDGHAAKDDVGVWWRGTSGGP